MENALATPRAIVRTRGHRSEQQPRALLSVSSGPSTEGDYSYADLRRLWSAKVQDLQGGNRVDFGGKRRPTRRRDFANAAVPSAQTFGN